MRNRPKAAWITVLLIGAVAALLLSGCGSSGGSTSFTGSGHPNVDTSNTRSVSGPIDSTSVSGLKKAWSLPLTAKSSFGSYAGSPVISEGVVYSQDLASNVQAIDLESGEVLWEKAYESPSLGPNGVVVADGRVHGATAVSAFALDQETGEEIWEKTLTRTPSEGIDMAPGYQDGLVYVSTVPTNASAAYEGGGVGILWALDAKTGKKAWSFDTVPKSLWGNPQVNAGGGLWYTPAFDEEGSMYFGVGNPAPFPGTEEDPWGSSRPGPNLYTNSLVKMDAKTGKLEWFYQQTPHDLYDWDFQGPPILVKAGGRQLVINSGKVGVVVAFDRKTGKVAWKRPVGTHNGHDNDSLLAMKGEYSKLGTSATVFPGVLGGVISPASTDGSTIFLPVVNQSVQVSGSGNAGSGAPGGELVALDVATGDVRWTHKFSSPAFGATTVVNDLVFATTYDGTVSAFNTKTGRIVWQEILPAGTNTGVMANGDTLIAPAGLPAAAGQRPQIVAYRLGG